MTEPTNGRLEAEPDCTCKVGSLVDAYDLRRANADLVERWTGERREEESVRSLADRFNRRLLRAAMRAEGMELIEGCVENFYALLTDDDTLEAERLRARSVLDENGVDVERVEEQFVSHQTVYRHLRNCLGAEKGTRTLSTDKERSRVNKMRSRAEAVTVDSLSRLRDGDELALEEFEVFVNLRVTCESCGALHDVTELLEQGGCDCQLTG
ncbi:MULTISPECIES: rod-determining factor RdfA [Halorussus]|uniref:rod-determining factor RdfA n=1 Tax=Halorussus TaxID=1070314 RepID=UPI00209DB0D5|nr:rod-determining factor RdfA [Halorussus vallis]USZ77874.1 hypothetical protein NGM07_22090 [Halorussus vallis]